MRERSYIYQYVYAYMRTHVRAHTRTHIHTPARIETHTHTNKQQRHTTATQPIMSYLITRPQQPRYFATTGIPARRPWGRGEGRRRGGGSYVGGEVGVTFRQRREVPTRDLARRP